MRTKSILVILALAALAQVAQSQTLEWAKKVGGPDYDEGRSIAADGSGNVYTTGYFEGSADFDPGAGSFNLTSAGGRDVFISKLDASGVFVWAKQIGGTSYDEGRSIAIDIFGNIYITGYFEGTADFDPGTGTYHLSSAGGSDIFIAKLDASGNFLWARSFGGTSSDNGYSITTDSSGNVYTTGTFQGTVDFDPGIGTYNLTSAGGLDIFILKLDASGHFVWAKQLGGTGGDFGFSIAVDGSGGVFTSGYFAGTADFDPGTGSFDLTSAGENDIFISKLDSSGQFVWAKSLGGTGHDEGRSIATDTSGNVYTTGYFYGTVDFDPGAGTFNLTSPGERNVFISKLDETGHFIWAKQLGGTSNDYGLSIATDVSGNVFTTGYFYYTADFDPGTGTFNLTSSGSGDVFISKLDTSGHFVWAKKLGGQNFEAGTSIAVDASGNVYTTGHFDGTANFQPGAGIFNLTAAGGYDVFIHKMSQSTSSFIEDVDKSPFSVFPNPTNGPLNIVIAENVSKATVIVRNCVGQEIFKKTYNSTNHIELNFEGEAGLYLMEITENNRKTFLKVLKQ